MSTAPEPTPPAGPREITIYSHSTIFYWWPVWAVGFVMALLTFIDNNIMAVVPKNTEVYPNAQVDLENKTLKSRAVLVFPENHKMAEDYKPHIRMDPSKNLGVVYAMVLLLIIVISNVPLRGLWSVIIILFIVLVTVVFALMDWLSALLTYFTYLQIHINLGGYVTISLVLFIIWAVTVFVFDHRHYLTVSSGQIRVGTAIGAGETVYDTTGMTFQKRQDDLFRHWVVGLGSGDLIIHRSAANLEIDFPNVLFVSSKIRQIESLIKEREVV